MSKLEEIKVDYQLSPSENKTCIHIWDKIIKIINNFRIINTYIINNY